jgi:dipeptidyl-peptidase 4
MKIRRTYSIAVLSFLLISLCSNHSSAQVKTDISLQDIWASPKLYPKMVSGFINLKDGKSYCKFSQDAETGNSQLIRYSYETGEQTGIVIDGNMIVEANAALGFKAFNFRTFYFSKDESKALIPLHREGIYRHSYRAHYYLWDKASNKLALINDKKIRYATMDPTGTKVAYVLDNNLYVKYLDKGKTKQLTKDGEFNKIINGAVDWVYEEEFSMEKGFDWNSDGSKIAYYRFDESKVKEWTIAYYGKLYPKQYKYKYPKTGEANSVVDVYICDLKGKRKKVALGSENDQYIPRIKWTKNPNILSVQRLNRHQNKWELLMVNAKSGTPTVSVLETNKYYVDINDDLKFLDDKKHFIMKSERNGYYHLYLHKNNGPQVFQITDGKWDVDQFLGIDEKNGKVYFTSTKVSSMERHIYSVDVDGNNMVQLSSKAGWNGARFSADMSTYLYTYSSANSPMEYSICNNNGAELRSLEKNEEFKKTMESLNMSPLEFGELSVEAGTNLNYYMIKPNNFDASKKHPLLMFVYGGPGSQQVTNRWLWSNFWWHQMLANKHGYVIACVDNRGTGGKGEEFKKKTYLQLGKYETEDQINSAKYFGKMSFIDEDRIGIWGWSYGGYMSSLCLTKGNDVFKAAIAVAPVTNWRYYDNIYTERYMRTPAENADGYDDNSPINFVDSLKGNYLIVHGTGDDNVHYQNSVEMVNKMISKNIPFESAYYPNKNHGISGGYTRMHLFTRMTKFILENL